MGTENRSVVSRAWGQSRRLTARGVGGTLWGDKNSLSLD